MSTSQPNSYQMVLRQCSDVLELQYQAMLKLQEEKLATDSGSYIARDDYQAVYRQLQDEKVEHAKTRSFLAAERERATFAEQEAKILSRQVEREKDTFEKAFGLLKSQALADSSKSEELVVKCTALEVLCSQKDEELAGMGRQLEQLQRQLARLGAAHRQQVEEMSVRMQQEVYIAKQLGGGGAGDKGLARKRRLD